MAMLSHAASSLAAASPAHYLFLFFKWIEREFLSSSLKWES